MTDMTEKQLAEKLDREFDSPYSREGWEKIARRAAELLGVTLAPEKPEPGLRILPGNSATRTVDRPALLDSSGSLYWLNDEGVMIEGAVHTQEEADRLTPARVISEAEYQEMVNYRDAARAEADEVDRLKGERSHLAAELDRLADHRNQLAAECDAWKAKAADRGCTVESPVLSEEEVEQLHNDNVDSTVVFNEMPEIVQVEQAAIIRAAYAAGAKHCGARELPTRDEVREAIKHSGGAFNMPSYDVDDITYHVMALLGGGDRGE